MFSFQNYHFTQIKFSWKKLIQKECYCFNQKSAQYNMYSTLQSIFLNKGRIALKETTVYQIKCIKINENSKFLMSIIFRTFICHVSRNRPCFLQLAECESGFCGRQRYIWNQRTQSQMMMTMMMTMMKMKVALRYLHF